MTNARPRSRTMPFGALATATLLAAGLAIVPALPATAAPLAASVGDATQLNAALLASADNPTDITLTANITTGGIAVPPTGTVTLRLNGNTLTATGAQDRAGIAVPVGAHLTVAGPTGSSIIATGGSYGAGIGGSNGESSGTINIESGTVTATGGLRGAGIGGGQNGAGGSTAISGGSIKAVSTSVGAGIGGGLYGAAGAIVISGGTVTASGAPLNGSGVPTNDGGAGIGTGFTGLSFPKQFLTGGSVTITGGDINAAGGWYGAGIGGGTGLTPLTIDITGGTVRATGSMYAAALGGNSMDPGATTTIGAGAEVYATSHALGTAIGAGKDALNQAPLATPLAFGSLSNAGTLRIPTDSLAIPAGVLVTNTGILQGAGTILNRGVLVTSGTMRGGGATGNLGIILNTGSYERPASLSPLPSLTFNRNDGSTPASIMQVFASSLDVATTDPQSGPILNGVIQAPTRTGYTFNGWFTAASGGTQWDPATALAGTTTVYAQWTINNYAVTFDHHNGAPDTSTTADHGTTLSAPPVPTRADYTFNGWFTAATDGTKWNFATDTITGATTLHAQWTINTYTVTFNSHDGSPITDGTATHNGLVIEPTTPPTRTGYTFDGWFTAATDGTKWNFTTDTITGATTLHAQWTINTYTVTFNSHDGSPISDGTATHNGLVIEPTTAPTRTGYTFNGWFTQATDGTAWNFATDTITGATTLHAQWTINTYTVTFNSQGGSPVADGTATHNGLVLQPTTAPTRTGYTFNGWFTQATDGTAWNFATDTITGATTLHAQWTINTYTVTFNSQKGTAVANGTATYNGLVGEPAAAPTRTGYTFNGWTTTADGGTPWVFDTNRVTGPTTIYATWTAKPVVPVTVTMTFDAKGGSAVKPITAPKGTPFTAPKAPTRTGYTFKGWFTDAATTKAWAWKTPATANLKVDAKWTRNAATAPTVQRVAGEDRYATSIAVSQLGYPKTAPVVYVATGLSFPDALAAAPAAAKLGGPLLLTSIDNVPETVKAEIKRLKPARIVVVGGTAVISDAVLKELTALQKNTVRLWGADRFQTANAIIADAFPGTVSESWLVTGTNFPDALSAAAVAGSRKVPVMLIDGAQTSVDKATKNLFSKLKPAKITIAGGPAAVSPGIETSLKSGHTVSRLAGADRYSTSLAINANSFTNPKTVYLATGSGFADALAGAAVAGATNGPLYVIPNTCVPSEILAKITAWGSTKVVVIGGTAALTSGVENLVPCA
ncbi:hypothetical protein GCM10022381_18630 [Leifsonia kafniensis]|uniref:Cell wall-binding repeat-containing protein n=1 Tax=Leifsonia kafniensis TaxID=475957 RepID=A0ABP7KFW0_9MICO